jgi:hypothetical protein
MFGDGVEIKEVQIGDKGGKIHRDTPQSERQRVQ